MDRRTARRLSSLTSEFYAEVSDSFAATRDAPWPGWVRVVAEAEAVLCPSTPAAPVRLLDLACGNLRFERFLDELLASRGKPAGPAQHDGCASHVKAVGHRPGGQQPHADATGREKSGHAPHADGDVQRTFHAADAHAAALRSMAVGSLEAFAFDGCDELAEAIAPSFAHVAVRYRHLDLAEALFAGEDLVAQMEAPACDLAVCLAFMHHLPLREHRAALLRSLIESVRPGGVVAVSFWQLSKSERLLRKAQATTARAVSERGLAGLGSRDYLLGWQGREDVLRYCHDFAEDEIDALAASVAEEARELARFSADGATGDLNRYLILQRRAAPAKA